MNSRCKITFVAVSLALAATVSHAASSSSAQIGPVGYTLIDLNPNDGIAPTITWATPYPGYGDYAYATAYDTAANNYPSQTNWGTNNFSTVSANAATALSGASTKLNGGLDVNAPAGATLSSSGYANGTTVAGQYSYYNAYGYMPYYGYGGAFTLGAGTAVLFTTQASASATTTVGYDGVGSEYGSSYARLDVWGSQPSGDGGSQNSSASFNAYAGDTATWTWNDVTQQYDYVYSGQQQSFSGVLSGAYVNATATDKLGYFMATTQVSGYSSIAAVPEPETYAMLLAGLGLVGTMARRRRRS